MSDDKTYLVISYFPLFDPRDQPGVLPGKHVDLKDEEDVKRIFGDLPSGHGHVEACLWVIDDDKPCPIFVLESAQAIYDHMEMWSEDEVEDWFELAIGEHNDRYGIVLMPNIQKSIDRYRLARKLFYGEDIPADAKFNLLFDTIRFTSQSAGLLASLKDKIGDSMKLMFLDSDHLCRENPEETDWEKAIEVGNFSVKRDCRYIEDLIEDQGTE